MAFETGAVDEHIHVYVRLRPRVVEEDEEEPAAEGTFVTPGVVEDEACVAVLEDGKACVYDGGGETKTRYEFEACLPETATQQEVYNMCARRVVSAVASGYNGTIVAYGQTGSGKTHTMRGLSGGDANDDERGVCGRAFQQLDEEATRCAKLGVRMTVSLSYVQIYNEVLTDLLVDEATSRQSALSIRERPPHDGGGVFVEGLSRVPVRSAAEAWALLVRGDAQRATAATLFNATSSRSHACALVHVERTAIEFADEAFNNSNNNNNKEKQAYATTRSTLTLVDLAGSERASKGGPLRQHQRFAEARAINLSLSALGNCVAALAAQRPHVPYRDSKLTRLLQASLGGCARTAIIATVRAYAHHLSTAQESRSTLEFASRAARVEVRAVPQEVAVDYRRLFEEAQRNLDAAESREAEAQAEIRSSKDAAEHLRTALEAAERDREGLRHKLANADARHADAAAALKKSRPGDGVGGGGGGGGAAAASGSSSLDAAEAIEDLHARWAAEAEAADARHEAVLAEAAAKADERVTAYRAAATTASDDCEKYEEELQVERTGHLATLAALRSVRQEKADAEDRAASRVAELLTEVDDLRDQQAETAAALDRAQLAAAASSRELAARVEALEEATIHERHLREDDFVGRDRVKEMEGLYSKTIQHLTDRLQHLEDQRDEIVAKTVAGGGARDHVSKNARNILDNLDQRRLPTLGGDRRLHPTKGPHRRVPGNLHNSRQPPMATKQPKGGVRLTKTNNYVDPRAVFY